MATPIRRIEKEFFLKALYDKRIPLVYLWDQKKYYLTLENLNKEANLVLKLDKPIAGLKPRTRMELMFDFQGQVISCVIEIDTIKDGIITAEVPEFLYKNLDRSYSRIAVPQDLQMRFSFHQDRYNLPFPKVGSFEDDSERDLIKEPYAQNASTLLDHMGAWVKSLGGSYKLVIFKDVKPSTTEERVVAETGKAFYLASTREAFPVEDPFPEERIITAGLFKRYLESTGVDPKYLDDTCRRFVQAKLTRGIFSDIWAPLLFQEYIVGYIHVWIGNSWAPPFDIAALERLFKYAGGLTRALKINGFFEKGRRLNEVFVGKVIDISVSGLLFVYPKSSLFSALLVNSRLLITLTTAGRTINANARIVRRYRDSGLVYYGCHFLDTSFEDMQYLFEYLYGKILDDTDAIFQIGKM
ncbi:MAG: PilZ domain-containing protein [Treponema sp.]|jgi:hypothetical protein|nr:PilZ domain-containing protein [Treponema sp.]